MKKKILVIVIIFIALVPIPMKLKDGGSIEYKALLYKFTKVKRLNENSSTGYEEGFKLEILGLNVYNKIDVYDNKQPTYKTIGLKINDYFSSNRIDLPNYSYSYIDEKSKKVIVGLIDNNEDDQNDFIDKVFMECCGTNYINYIKKHNMIEFKESKEIFEGKIIEIEEKFMIVQVINECVSFDLEEKVIVRMKNQTDKLNDLYTKGDKIKITFNGLVEQSKPPQIEAIKIDITNW